MARRRRRGAQRALWAAIPVDVLVRQTHPTPGWVVLKELFVNKEHVVPGTDTVLSIARVRDTNTMRGEVLAIHDVTANELKIGVGDTVVYKEYSGGRWTLSGDVVLITPAEDILACVQ